MGKLALLITSAAFAVACENVTVIPDPPRSSPTAFDDDWRPPPVTMRLPAPRAEPTEAAPAGRMDNWSSADRTVLEAQAKAGLVGVRRSEDGTIEVLPSCAIRGNYTYTSVTPKEERITVHDPETLRVVVPLDALALKPELARLGALDVMTTTVGYYRANQPRVSRADLPPGCEAATEVVIAMTVGAQSVVVDTKSRWEILRSDGNTAECAMGDSDESRAPKGCGALLRLEMASIAP